jgi:hypothetical protein
MSGFQVPGTLSVSQSALDDLSLHALTQEVTAQEFTATRTAATTSQAFTYYIQCEYDINASISHQASGTSGDDDSWGMAEISLAKSSFVGVTEFKYPAAAGIPVPAGLITAKDTDASSISTFAVTLSLSASDQGALSASAAISGADAVSSATPENLLNAQVVQFMKPSASAPTPAASDDDVLTATLTAAELSSDYSAELAAIEAAYTIADMVSAWTILIPAIPLLVDSILSQHARLGAKTSAAVFSPGELMVAATAASYSVAVNDYQGNSVSVVEAANVFAVLKQTA